MRQPHTHIYQTRWMMVTVWILAISLTAVLAANARAAGNVTVQVDTGALLVFGDDEANSITLSEIGDSNEWLITGLAGTKVNGGKNFTTPPATSTCLINLFGGNDKVKITNSSFERELDIYMGEGDDSTSLTNVTVKAFLDYQGNGGKNTFKATTLTIQDLFGFGQSSISMGTENDSVKLQDVTIQDLGLSIDMGDGNNKLTITDLTFLSSFPEAVSVSMGAGKDSATLKSLTAVGPLSADMGGGDKDVLKISASTAPSNVLDGGPGEGDKLMVITSDLGTGTPTGFELP